MLIIHEVVATIVATVVAGVTATTYIRSNKGYSRSTKPIPSVRHFVWVSPLIQATSLVWAIGTFLTDKVVFLQLHNSTSLLYCGLVISVVGELLFLEARRALGRHYTPCFDSYMPRAIVENGPYALIRHPIYTANIAILAGFSISTGSPVLILNTAVLAAYYIHAARTEERYMLSEYPAYSAYVLRSGMFLPRFSP